MLPPRWLVATFTCTSAGMQVTRHERCRLRVTISKEPGAFPEKGHKVSAVFQAAVDTWLWHAALAQVVQGWLRSCLTSAACRHACRSLWWLSWWRTLISPSRARWPMWRSFRT